MPRRASRFLAFAALALLAFPAILLARAGGGQSYSGGRSSGGGGGSGDIGDLLYLLFQFFRFCYYYPYIGVPILAVAVAFFFFAGRQGKSSWQSHIIRKANARYDLSNREHILRALHSRDP